MQSAVRYTSGFLAILLMTTPSLAFARRVPTQTQTQSSTPTIMTRAGWGADESLGIVQTKKQESDTGSTTAIHGNGRSISDKEKKCQEAQRIAPEDFVVDATVTHDRNGNPLVWPRRYSKDVKLIVIHHTGEELRSEFNHLSGIEQVRAIYRTHTAINGWGDIGYHYIIDRNGIIYEGRAGGHGVVGAHVYCSNVNTIGIALIGNFTSHYPSEEQLKSLRWLLIDQAQEYDINLAGKADFHGEIIPTVVTHRDLGPTQCAGRHVQHIKNRIIAAAARGDIASNLIPSTSSVRIAGTTTAHLSSIGSQTLHMTPRSVQAIRLSYVAGSSGMKTGQSIAKITRSDRLIGVFQERSGSRIRVKDDVRATQTLTAKMRDTVSLRILAPRDRGTYTLTIGENKYTLIVE